MEVGGNSNLNFDLKVYSNAINELWFSNSKRNYKENNIKDRLKQKKLSKGKGLISNSPVNFFNELSEDQEQIRKNDEKTTRIKIKIKSFFKKKLNSKLERNRQKNSE